MHPIAFITPLYLAALAAAASTCPPWTLQTDPLDLNFAIGNVVNRLLPLTDPPKGDGEAACNLEAEALFEGMAEITTILSKHIDDLITNLGHSTETPICDPKDQACLDRVTNGINVLCKRLYDPETKPASGLLGVLPEALRYFGRRNCSVWICKPMASIIEGMTDMLGKWTGPLSSRLSGPAKEAVVTCFDRVKKQTTIVTDKYRKTN